MRRIRAEKWKQGGNRGLAIRIRRVCSRLNQSDLAQRSGINQGRISLLENGYVYASARERLALTAALGCAEEDLFPGGEKD